MSEEKPSVKFLLAEYRRIKPEIKKRLSAFHKIIESKDEEIFSELSYCILTANANAVRCDEAIKELEKRNLLLNGKAGEIRPILRGRARFHNKKADYIVGARNLFSNKGRLNIKSRLNMKDISAARDWLVDNIRGFGYKEASHFLRNVGLGKDLAILDRHILKNLKRYGAIRKMPSSVGSKKIYIEIESKMREFSKRTKIPMEELDLLFWSMQTGFIFK